MSIMYFPVATDFSLQITNCIILKLSITHTKTCYIADFYKATTLFLSTHVCYASSIYNFRQYCKGPRSQRQVMEQRMRGLTGERAITFSRYNTFS